MALVRDESCFVDADTIRALHDDNNDDDDLQTKPAVRRDRKERPPFPMTSSSSGQRNPLSTTQRLRKHKHHAICRDVNAMPKVWVPSWWTVKRVRSGLFYLKKYFLFFHFSYISLIAIISSIVLFFFERNLVRPRAQDWQQMLNETRSRDIDANLGNLRNGTLYIDCLFVSVSAVTTTGLSTSDMSTWHIASRVWWHIIQVLGGAVLTTTFPVILRQVTLRGLFVHEWRYAPTSRLQHIQKLIMTSKIILISVAMYWVFWHVLGFLLLLSELDPLQALYRTISAFNGAAFRNAQEDFTDKPVSLIVFCFLAAAGGPLFPVLLRVHIMAERRLFSLVLRWGTLRDYLSGPPEIDELTGVLPVTPVATTPADQPSNGTFAPPPAGEQTIERSLSPPCCPGTGVSFANGKKELRGWDEPEQQKQQQATDEEDAHDQTVILREDEEQDDEDEDDPSRPPMIGATMPGFEAEPSNPFAAAQEDDEEPEQQKAKRPEDPPSFAPSVNRHSSLLSDDHRKGAGGENKETPGRRSTMATSLNDDDARSSERYEELDEEDDDADDGASFNRTTSSKSSDSAHLGLPNASIISVQERPPPITVSDLVEANRWLHGFDHILRSTTPGNHHHFLFVPSETVYLFTAWLGIVVAVLIPFFIEQWNRSLREESPVMKVLVAVAQSITIRFTSLNFIDLTLLSPGHVLVMVVALYLPKIPIPHERSRRKWDQLFQKGVWKLITSRFWWLFASITVILFLEEDRLHFRFPEEAWSHGLVLLIIFEVISAYSTSGVSLTSRSYSLSGEFSVASKTIVIFNMLAGRHRNLDLGLDLGLTHLEMERATALPDDYRREEILKQKEKEESKRNEPAYGEQPEPLFFGRLDGTVRRRRRQEPQEERRVSES